LPSGVGPVQATSARRRQDKAGAVADGLAAGPANGYMWRDQRETSMLALIQTVVLALDIYWWLIIASAIFSWLYAFNVVNSRNQFVDMVSNFLYRVTEPALRPIRRFMPDLGGIDISPIVLLLLLFFIRQFIVTTVAPALLT
jgi:YggT family protein